MKIFHNVLHPRIELRTEIFPIEVARPLGYGIPMTLVDFLGTYIIMRYKYKRIHK